jgi:copper homeostasis protein
MKTGMEIRDINTTQRPIVKHLFGIMRTRVEWYSFFDKSSHFSAYPIKYIKLQYFRLMNYSLEICAYSAESVLRAARAGAHRVELCAGRLEGGTTPSAGLIQEALAVGDIDVFPIIRPRGGDFCYTDAEFREMLYDIEMLRETGVKGIVTGVLLPDGNMDIHRMAMLKDTAGDMEFCCHRAIDMTRNMMNAMEQLIELGVKRVLSSGGHNTAIEGIETLSQLQQTYGSQIEIMAGSGVNSRNILQLMKVGIRHFHASAGRLELSPMQYRNEHISMGKESGADEFARFEADETEIVAMLTHLKNLQLS